MSNTEPMTMLEPVAYADPVAFQNFKDRGHLGGVHGREWMWANPDNGLVALHSAEQVNQALAEKSEHLEGARAEMAELDERATAFQVDLEKAQNRIKDLAAALHVAEAALADIGDADREPGDDLAWCEDRAAQALPKVRATLASQIDIPSRTMVDGAEASAGHSGLRGVFLLNREYPTRGGGMVKLVSIHNPGMDHETMACADGVHRYTRRTHPLDFGRVTGTDGTDVRDLVLAAHPATLGEKGEIPAPRCPTAYVGVDASHVWRAGWAAGVQAARDAQQGGGS